MRNASAEVFLADLSESTRGHVFELAGTLKRAGRQCWLVGGCVRDLLLRRTVLDLDFTTDARPEEVRRLFRSTVPTGIRHGTITVLLEGEAFEVTTFRGEGAYSDGRRPDEVRFADTLSEDLQRRDFTVNALAWNPETGELVDEHGGLGDLETRTLRTIGRPEDRFFEDGLRPVRACRFAATLGFHPDEAVLAALRSETVQERVALVAVERFADELRKGLRAEQASPMVQLLEATGLRGIFITAPKDLSAGELQRLDDLGSGPLELKLAYWWGRIGLSDPASTARSLKLSRHEERFVLLYGRLIEFAAGAGTASDVALRRFLSEVREVAREESATFLMGIPPRAFPDFPRETCLRILAQDPLAISDLALGGEDLLRRGISGPTVGLQLRRLLDLVLEDPSRNTRAQLEAELDRSSTQ